MSKTEKECALLSIWDKTQDFLNDLLELSKKYNIEFHNWYIYKKDSFEFWEQYVWSHHWIEIEDFIG